MPGEIIAWLESTARGWNQNSTPFAWGGKRRGGRQRARERRHALGDSGAETRRLLSDELNYDAMAMTKPSDPLVQIEFPALPHTTL